MADIKYKLRYLSVLYEELEQKVLYIAEKLCNLQVANELLNAVEKAILERASVAASFEAYHSLKDRRYPYYQIYVKNYVVIDDEREDKMMGVRRFL